MSVFGGASLFSPAFRRLLLMHLAFGLCLSTFLILPKYLAGELHASGFEIGVVMSTYGLANVLLVRPLRSLLLRWSHRRVLATGTMLTTAGGALFVWVDSAGPLAASARFIQGAGWACVFTSGSAMAANIAPPGRMAQAIGFFAAAMLATNALGPAFAEAMLPRLGAMVWFIGAAWGAVAFFVTLRLPQDGDANAVPEIAHKSVPGQAARETLPPIGTVVPLPFLVVWLISGLLSTTMFTFHQPLALDRGFSRVSTLLIVFTIAALSVRLVTGRLLDRIGHRRVALSCLTAHGAATLSMHWLGPIGLEPLGLVLGVSYGAFYPAMMALCMSRVTPRYRALAITRINTANHLGALGVWLLGFLADTAGYSAVFITTGMTGILGAQLLLRREPERAVPLFRCG